MWMENKTGLWPEKGAQTDSNQGHISYVRCIVEYCLRVHIVSPHNSGAITQQRLPFIEQNSQTLLFISGSQHFLCCRDTGSIWGCFITLDLVLWLCGTTWSRLTEFLFSWHHLQLELSWNATDFSTWWEKPLLLLSLGTTSCYCLTSSMRGYIQAV